MTRPVVVVEAEAGGHRMIFFAAVASWLVARGVRVTLATTREALDSDDLAMRRPAGAEVVEIPDTGSVRGLVEAVARVQADHPGHDVLVTEGDKFLLALACSRAPVDPRRLRVLVMRAPWTTDRGPAALARDTAKAATMRLAAWRGVDVRVLEPATTVRERYRLGRWPSVPDPVDVRPGERPDELDALGTDRHWLGVLGHTGPRKNLDLVLRAAAAAGGDRIGVLVAGRVEDGEWARCAAALAAFTTAGGALVAADRLLSDAALDACVAAVDTVVLAHSSEGPSGILGRAAALGVPVLAAGARSLRDDVARLGAGTWVPLDAGALAAAVTGRSAATGRARAGGAALAGTDEFARALLS